MAGRLVEVAVETGLASAAWLLNRSKIACCWASIARSLLVTHCWKSDLCRDCLIWRHGLSGERVAVPGAEERLEAPMGAPIGTGMPALPEVLRGEAGCALTEGPTSSRMDNPRGNPSCTSMCVSSVPAFAATSRSAMCPCAASLRTR
eukprot:6457611-Amphidinium_carterae.1